MRRKIEEGLVGEKDRLQVKLHFLGEESERTLLEKEKETSAALSILLVLFLIFY